MSDEGERQPPERPDYKVYRSGGGEGERREPPKRKREKRDETEAKEPAPKEPQKPREPKERPKAAEPPKSERPAGEKPEYKVYRSRPGALDRLRKPDLAGLRRAGGGGLRERLPSFRGGERRWLWWVLIAIGGWLLISFLAFAISAQIQKGDLSDEAKDALAGGPDVLAGQNILILGGDQRGKQVGSEEPGAEGASPRADTIMVLHAALTSFRKLSIPRDTIAEVPGFGAERINGAFSLTGFRNGDAALMIRTVEDFLGIDINHIIIVDFDGFVDFIDSLGGVSIDLKKKVCGEVSGGKENGGVTIKLKAGEHTLQSQKALALSRLRKNECDPSEDDRDRAERQQLLLNGIKGRLTSPTRAPINFIKGPWIGWAAPKAFISDMGGLTLPQVAIAAFFGGSSDTNVLKPSGPSSGGGLVVDQSECERAVEKLTGGPPDEAPTCSPG